MDMILYYPTDKLGEVGEPLPADLMSILGDLAGVDWWPVSFGEQGAPDHGEYTEVLLTNDNPGSGLSAYEMLTHWLKDQ